MKVIQIKKNFMKREGYKPTEEYEKSKEGKEYERWFKEHQKKMEQDFRKMNEMEEEVETYSFNINGNIEIIEELEVILKNKESTKAVIWEKKFLFGHRGTLQQICSRSHISKKQKTVLDNICKKYDVEKFKLHRVGEAVKCENEQHDQSH